MTDAERAQDDIEAEAAAWAVRLDGPTLSAAERADLDRWIGRSPAHQAALDIAQKTWADLGRLGAAQPAPARDAPRAPVRPAPGRPAMVRVGRRWAVGALAASLLLFAALDPLRLGETRLFEAADFRTAPGEIRTVALPDGSTATLNTASAIRLSFDGVERRVELVDGEAAFTAAPARDNGGRPFVVAAGPGTARALGTRFVVRRDDGGVEVTVIEHQVAVSAAVAGSADSAPVVLSPGQRVRYDAAHGVGPVDSIDIGRATAWQRGRLVFDKVPLSTAIAEINRYRRARIAVLDGALARREVSGVFRLDDLDGAVDTIAAELGARTASLPPFVTLLF